MNGICGAIALAPMKMDLSQGFSNMLSALSDSHGSKVDSIAITDHIFIGSSVDSSHERRFGLASDTNNVVYCAVQGNCYLDDDARAMIKSEYGVNIEVGIACIPYAYLLLGKNLPLHLTGTYNIVVFDARSHEVLLFNSRFGMLPLYYTNHGNALIFCSSLRALKKSQIIPDHTNKITLIESAIFNYPISDNSFIENVSTLPSASMLLLSDTGPQLRPYWNMTELFCEPLFNKNESVELIDGVLSRVIKKLIEGRDSFGLSLTGGWDGRLILSYLKNVPKDKFFLYSFGGAGSADTEIPKVISSDLGCKYYPFILDDEYLRNDFFESARTTITRSDGMRSYLRAHYLYTMGKLEGMTGMVLSGNCGSNLLKNVNSTGSVVSKALYRVVNSRFSKDEIAALFDEFHSTGYMYLDGSDKERFVNAIYEIKPDSGMTLNQQFYQLLLSIVEKKYFGAEISSYPGGLVNQSPFIDYEFVKTIAQTPYFGAHYEFFGRKISDRWMLAKLYTALIKKNHRELADYETDRGFSLKELASWTCIPKLAYKRFIAKGSRFGHDNFNTSTTNGQFLSMMKSGSIEDNIYNIGKLESALHSNEYIRDRESFANCLSLLYWKTHCLQ